MHRYLQGNLNAAFDDDAGSEQSTDDALDTDSICKAAAAAATMKTGVAPTRIDLEDGLEGGKKQTAVEDSDEDWTEPTEVRSILRRFMMTTSAHGWKNVARHQNKTFNVLWFFLIVMALVLCVVQVSSLILQYLRFPYEQRTTVQAAFVAFPSVTICNLQSISMSTAGDMLKNSSTKFFQWNELSSSLFAQAQDNVSSEYEFWYDRLRGPQGFYDNIGTESRVVGHQEWDFIVGCTYGKNDCALNSFTYFSSPNYYNCYTYNGGNISADKVMTRASGPENGLSLVIYLETDNGDHQHDGPYYSFHNSGNAAGARVVIHSPDTRPNPVESGFSLPPGFTTSVSLKVGVNRRLGSPYDNCDPDPKPIDGGRFLESMQSCLMSCEQSYIFDRCNCLSSALVIPDDYADWMTSEENPQPVFCGRYNASDPFEIFNRSKCEMDAILHFFSSSSSTHNVQQCGCHPPCHELTYISEMSYSYWPLDFVQESFYTNYILNDENYEDLKAYQNLRKFNLSQLVTGGLIRNNFARVNIYPQSLTITEYVEKGKYTFFNLFSSIGGTFGLWIGMSLLTWMEVGEFVIYLIIVGVKELHLRLSVFRRSS